MKAFVGIGMILGLTWVSRRENDRRGHDRKRSGSIGAPAGMDASKALEQVVDAVNASYWMEVARPGEKPAVTLIRDQNGRRT